MSSDSDSPSHGDPNKRRRLLVPDDSEPSSHASDTSIMPSSSPDSSMADPNTNMGEAILQGRPLDIPVSAESDIAALQNELTRVRNERDRERNERDQERNERAQDQAELSMLRRIVAQRQRQDIEVAGVWTPPQRCTTSAGVPSFCQRNVDSEYTVLDHPLFFLLVREFYHENAELPPAAQSFGNFLENQLTVCRQLNDERGICSLEFCPALQEQRCRESWLQNFLCRELSFRIPALVQQFSFQYQAALQEYSINTVQSDGALYVFRELVCYSGEIDIAICRRLGVSENSALMPLVIIECSTEDNDLSKTIQATGYSANAVNCLSTGCMVLQVVCTSSVLQASVVFPTQRQNNNNVKNRYGHAVLLCTAVNAENWDRLLRLISFFVYSMPRIYGYYCNLPLEKISRGSNVIMRPREILKIFRETYFESRRNLVYAADLLGARVVFRSASPKVETFSVVSYPKIMGSHSASAAGQFIRILVQLHCLQSVLLVHSDLHRHNMVFCSDTVPDRIPIFPNTPQDPAAYGVTEIPDVTMLLTDCFPSSLIDFDFMGVAGTRYPLNFNWDIPVRHPAPNDKLRHVSHDAHSMHQILQAYQVDQSIIQQWNQVLLSVKEGRYLHAATLLKPIQRVAVMLPVNDSVPDDKSHLGTGSLSSD